MPLRFLVGHRRQLSISVRLARTRLFVSGGLCESATDYANDAASKRTVPLDKGKGCG